MIFYGREDWRAESPPGLATGAEAVFRDSNIKILNDSMAKLDSSLLRINMLGKPQVELESRLTGLQVNLAGSALPLGHTISHIPILEDARRTWK